MIRALAILCVIGHAAHAGTCYDSLLDPVVTSIRDAGIDTQRAACLRDELAIRLGGAALVDTPGFHGVLSGHLRGSARARVRRNIEVGADVQLLDAAFVQNAVNTATRLALGPITVNGAYWAAENENVSLVLAGSLELRGTQTSDDTVRTSGELTAVVSAELAPAARLHARFGGVWMLAASTAGDTERVAFRAGVDVTRRFIRPISVLIGAEVQTGWYGGGLDHVNLRAGFQFRLHRGWRGAIAIGVPVGGEERTNVVLDLGAVHAL